MSRPVVSVVLHDALARALHRLDQEGWLRERAPRVADRLMVALETELIRHRYAVVRHEERVADQWPRTPTAPPEPSPSPETIAPPEEPLPAAPAAPLSSLKKKKR